MEKHVLVVGGCSLDLTFEELENGRFWSEPNRITPGGKGANQAVAASRAGAKVKMISRLSGKDKNNTKIILDNLKQNKVDTSLIEIDNEIGNDLSEVYVSLEGDNNIIRHNDAINSFSSSLIKNNEEVIKNAEFVLIQMKAPKNFTYELVDYCYKNGVKVVLTPCPPDKLNINNKKDNDLIDKITFITCNASECKKIFGNSFEEAIKKYPNKLFVTLGESGICYFNGENIVRVPAVKVEKVIDTTGAGDTLCGNFVASLLCGKSLNESLTRGTYASALKIQKETAQAGMPTKKELDTFIKKECPTK